MAACIGLYAEVMGLRPSDGGLNPRLLTALQSNGGIVVAAYEGDGDPTRPVGFAYSFLAREGVASCSSSHSSPWSPATSRGRGGAAPQACAAGADPGHGADPDPLVVRPPEDP